MRVTREQVTDAIHETLNAENLDFFPFDMEPEEINNGSCDEFAQAICAYLNFPDNLQPSCAEMDQPQFYHHVWLILEDEGKTIYFDADQTLGLPPSVN